MPGRARVSVVMITRDRAAETVATVAHLLALPEHPEVVVVDNASRDDTVGRVGAAYPDVEVIALSENLGGAGRNVGMNAVSTPYVAFADDDSWWAPGALGRAVELFDAHPSLGLLAAAVLVGADRHLDPTCSTMARSPLGRRDDLPGPSILGFIACGAVVRRDAFVATGGFEALLGVGGEEQALALDLAAAGWDLCYVPELVAIHEPSPVRDRARRRRVVARNDLWTSWLRRPWRGVARDTASAVRAGLGDEAQRAAVIEAARALPAVLARRRVIPKAVDEQLVTVATGAVGVAEVA